MGEPMPSTFRTSTNLKAATRTVMLFQFAVKFLSLVAIILILLWFKQKCFTSSDILGLNGNIMNIQEESENFYTLTLWIHGKNIQVQVLLKIFIP